MRDMAHHYIGNWNVAVHPFHQAAPPACKISSSAGAVEVRWLSYVVVLAVLVRSTGLDWAQWLMIAIYIICPSTLRCLFLIKSGFLLEISSVIPLMHLNKSRFSLNTM